MSAPPRPATFALYLITDRRLAGGGTAPCEAALSAARDAGARVAVQLREKDLGGRELCALCRELKMVCARYGAPLLVNDRIDVALACGADGVHLPADSFTVADARKLLGPARLIGVSAHDAGEVETAAAAGADFAVFGPVFRPISKPGYGPVTGTQALARACKAGGGLPVYALGGITPERVGELRGAGVAGVAVIGAVFSAASPGDATRTLLRALAACGLS